MRASLHIGSSFADAWDDVFLPWFQNAPLGVSQESEPAVVVTPFTTDAAFLRWKLLEHGISLLGIRFVTPAQLREIVVQNGAPIPLREHLRLLLAIAAEKCIRSRDADLAAIAKSIARSPDDLLRTLDQLSAAGWSIADVALPAVRTIADKFLRFIKQCGFRLVHEADRAALETASAATPKFSDLLVSNFTSAQWHLWPLLHSAVLSAKRATLVLEYPREQTHASDEAWVGTWEEALGAATPFSCETKSARPFGELVRSASEPADFSACDGLQFLVGINASEQAQAIVTMSLKFLSKKSCTRLGILFPRAGALSRLVSELLARRDIPHYDAIGHFSPGEFETTAWSAWLELQENHQLSPLLGFFDASPDSCCDLPVQTVRDELERAYKKILIDDVAVLREYCACQTAHIECRAIADLLAKTKFLSASATLSVFLGQTKTIFTELKWANRWAEIERVSQGWSQRLDLEFPRAIYLRWLREITDSFTVARSPQSDHPYSRVHLISYPEAEGKEWSHLILAGLNQGEWPQSERESRFLRDQQIDELNARAIATGSHGEGHRVLRPGKNFLLGARHRRQIALRQFNSAIESTNDGLAIAATLHQDSTPERLWNPSELFTQIYFRSQGRLLTQETMSSLQRATRAWLDQQHLIGEHTPIATDVAQTRVAYDARHRADEPFGEYEFSLRQPIGRKITLRATQWDRVVKAPALIWMKVYLDVQGQDRNFNEWTTATGDWVHDWLAQISEAAKQNIFVKLPPAFQLRERVAQAAHGFRDQIVELCRSCGRVTPDWWFSGWSNAFAVAECLASKLAERNDWPRAATEWLLASPQTVSLEAGKLRLGGRIDLILAQHVPEQDRLQGANLWIVDYKTGNKKTLTVTGNAPEARLFALHKKLVRGDAIQLGLYGLAARELGAVQINVSLLSPLTELENPQLTIGDLAADSDFWNELYRMQETGIFGLLGLIRSEFSFTAAYPLATLPMDKEFLQEKWALTHPSLAIEEDDRS